MALSQRTRFIGSLWLTFAVGLFLAWPWHLEGALGGYPSLLEFAKDDLPRLGDALMIAPIVIWAIEKAAAHELLDTFVSDLSPHIIGNLLPIEPAPTKLLDGLEWVVKRPMLPGQSIITRWARKPPPAVPGSPAAPAGAATGHPEPSADAPVKKATA